MHTMLGAHRKHQAKVDSGGTIGESLIKLLTEANTLLATNPRDLIYGFYGIANDMHSLGVIVDYGKSCVQLFTEVGQKLIKQGNVDILTMSQFPKQLPSDDGKVLPSWVPDWTLPVSKPLWDMSDSSTPFNVSGNTRVEVIIEGYELETKDGAVVLKGARIDQIEIVGTETSNTRPGEPGLISATQRLALLKEVAWACEESSKRQHKIFASPQRQKEAVWRVSIGDMEHSSGSLPATLRATEKSRLGHELALNIYGTLDKVRQVQEMWERISQQPSAEVPAPTQLTVQDIMGLEAERTEMARKFDKPAAKSYTHMMDRHDGRRPYMSTKGYIGLGPQSCKLEM